MPFTLEIRFGKSASKSYPEALRLLKKFSNVVAVTDEGQDNSVTISEGEFIEKRRKVTELWGLVSNWKSSRILINGEPAEFADLNTFSTVFGCFEKYKTAVIQEEHCSSYGPKKGWGCRWLQEVNSNLPEGSWSRGRYWYQIGYFSTEKTWKIDKERLRSVLQREIEIKKIFLCPVFNDKKIGETLDGLPDQIDVTTDTAWQIIYEESRDGTTAEKQPVGIQPVIKRRDAFSISFNGLGDKQAKPETNGQSESRNIPEITFPDIGGIDDIIETIREIIELPIKKPEILKYLGIKPHKGILLHGMPGCGKTLIAKAIANEIRAHFISIRGPELLSKWHGQSEENLRKVFEEAKQFQPSIIYFDEIDSIAQARSGDESLRFDARFVNQLLTLMDGVEDYGNVRVIASTNRVELIDNALLRPGRFDFTIEVKKPTLEGCFQIFTIQTKNIPVDPGFDKRLFSKRLFGLTGAEIAFVAREGAYNCLRRNVDLRKAIADDELEKIEYQLFVVTKDDFELALNTLKHNAA
jgi:transitional endoplasmic reticulum ATPase